MKKTICAVAIIILLILSVFTGCRESQQLNLPQFSDAFHPANTCQPKAVWEIGAWDGTLYRYGAGKTTVLVWGKQTTGLYRLDEDGFSEAAVQQTIDWSKTRAIGFSGSYFYFFQFDKEWPTGLSDRYDLCALSLSDGEADVILTLTQEEYLNAVSFFSPDGTLYLSVPEREDMFYPILDGRRGEAEQKRCAYLLGGYEYYLKQKQGSTAAPELIAEKTVAQRIPLPEAASRSVVPVEDGLLVLNQGFGHLLYLIRPSGETEELFSVPCMSSTSAINVIGEYVYLSVERYEGWNSSGIGMKHYEDDTIQGSYKINWKTGETKKCSDALYSGLFVFGDTLVGCDGNRIVLLDDDFQVIEEINVN